MESLNKKIAIRLLIIVLLVIFAFFAIYNFYDFDKKVENKKISIIVYGDDTDRWENLKRGAALAAEDNNAEVSLITMSSESDFEEQKELIAREIQNGVDGILLAACDSNEIGRYLDEKRISIPIVLVDNSLNSNKKYTCVAADAYEMGKELGEALIERENPIIKAAIIHDGYEKNSVALREQGVRDVLEPYANKVVTWERGENEQYISAKAFLQRQLTNEAVDVIVALDNEMADAIMDALENLNMTRKVYVISTSNQSVYYLDQEMIKVIEYQTEFGMGYVGVYEILNHKYAKKHFGKDVIKYKVVDKDSMYDYDNQMLLFPFVK